jgi:hypothetical protein
MTVINGNVIECKATRSTVVILLRFILRSGTDKDKAQKSPLKGFFRCANAGL